MLLVAVSIFSEGFGLLLNIFDENFLQDLVELLALLTHVDEPSKLNDFCSSLRLDAEHSDLLD
jgi:hypothetical protein